MGMIFDDGIITLIDDARKWLVFARGHKQVALALRAHGAGRWGSGISVSVNIHPDDTDYEKVDIAKSRVARVSTAQWLDSAWQAERISLTAKYFRFLAARADRDVTLFTLVERIKRLEHMIGVYNGRWSVGGAVIAEPATSTGTVVLI